ALFHILFRGLGHVPPLDFILILEYLDYTPKYKGRQVRRHYMNIKSVSGFSCAVKDLKKTAAFYEALGFDIRRREANFITAYSNWYWIELAAIGKDERAKAAPAKGKGGGILIYMSVDDVDGFYKFVKSKGIKPASEPKDQPWGNREFMMRDPD